MVKISKTKADGKFLYINLLDFKDEEEWNETYEKIKGMIKQ